MLVNSMAILMLVLRYSIILQGYSKDEDSYKTLNITIHSYISNHTIKLFWYLPFDDVGCPCIHNTFTLAFLRLIAAKNITPP